MRIIILLNPAASGGRARTRLAETLEVLRSAGIEPEVDESRDSQHLLELAGEAREKKPDLVVAAGGDGTAHEVLNALAGSAVPLGLIPLGRGNDLASGLGVPSDPRAAARVLLDGKTREIDLARVGPRFYGCIAGVGFDSVVNRYANENAGKTFGRVAYAWGILRCLASYHPQPLDLRSDGGNYRGEVMFAVVGNNISYGGGVKMAPRAQLDDGLLDVCIVPAMGKLEFLRWVPRAYRGMHLAHPRIVYFQARKVGLASPSRLELFADGEFIQSLPATIEVVPQSLRVRVPK